MWQPVKDRHRFAWHPDCWCVAKLQLCGAFERDEADETFRYPEQWIYFLWRPTHRSMPFRRPDCYGLVTGDPKDEISRNTGSASFYFVEDDECDWPALLEIPLVCSDMEPWLAELVRQAAERKHAEARARYLELYGNDGRDFQRFLDKAGAFPPSSASVLDFGDPVGKERSHVSTVEAESQERCRGARDGAASPAHSPSGDALSDCVCMTPRWLAADAGTVDVGVDETSGRFGDVTTHFCFRCDRQWLRYFVEYEDRHMSGRWFRGLVSSELAASVTPETAVAVLNGLPWHFRGGSYFESLGELARGRVRPDW